MIANCCNSELVSPIGGTTSFMLTRKRGYRTFSDLRVCQLLHIGDRVHIEYASKGWLPTKVRIIYCQFNVQVTLPVRQCTVLPARMIWTDEVMHIASKMKLEWESLFKMQCVYVEPPPGKGSPFCIVQSPTTNWPMTLSLLGVKQKRATINDVDSQVETRSSGLSSMLSRSSSSLKPSLTETSVKASPTIDTSTETAIQHRQERLATISLKQNTTPESRGASYLFRFLITLLVSVLVTGIYTMAQRIDGFVPTERNHIRSPHRNLHFGRDSNREQESLKSSTRHDE